VTKLHEVNLETFAGGAAPERFERELGRVLRNIMDPNTDPEALREIALKFKIKPDETRTFLRTRLEVTSKLAPARPVETPLHLAEKGGRYVAVGYDPRQPDLFPGAQDPDANPARATPTPDEEE
jgi:hypothetical protein